ncbi:MAG: bifunctional riboflavin kinase/FAD synthetase [Ignavibacteriaceae bacterium]
MEIFEDLSKVTYDKNTVVTLGTFDGIHAGHKKIIEEVVARSSFYGGRNFLITFDPHPRSIVSKDYKIQILSTLEEKLKLLEAIGIQNVLVIKFTKEFSQLSANEFFLKYVLKGIGIREIVIGHDHHFGKGRDGDENKLRELGKANDFKVTPVDAVSIDSMIVSSTKIRNLLTAGDVKTVNLFLGRFYSFSGKVVEGDKRGRELGFPTANIEPDNLDKLLPAIGIYAVEFFINNEEKKYIGVMSIGKRPTFYNEGKLTTEVYIFDFDKDIYGAKVTVKVVDRIRGEEKFSSAEELVIQMNKDVAAGMEILRRKVN